LRKQTVKSVFGIIKSVWGFSNSFCEATPSRRRMALGAPGVEFEAHGRIASSASKKGMIVKMPQIPL
jgi:hypothetical protein